MALNRKIARRGPVFVMPVLDELRRWEGMGVKEYSNFVSADGLLNEFAMMWSLREAFPLHFIIFKQTACHLPHEGNVEGTSPSWSSKVHFSRKRTP